MGTSSICTSTNGFAVVVQKAISITQAVQCAEGRRCANEKRPLLMLPTSWKEAPGSLLSCVGIITSAPKELAPTGPGLVFTTAPTVGPTTTSGMLRPNC